MKQIIQKYKIFSEPMLSGILIVLALLFSKQPIISPCLFIASFVIGGYKQALQGFRELIYERRFDVELLMVFAAIGASIIGYWQEGAMLIFIFSLSGALEEYATDKSKKEIHKLMDLQPLVAKRLDEMGNIETISVEQLKIGDHLLVSSGEAVATDGIIIDGTSSFNEAAITGEAFPKEKTIGAEIFGGTINTIQPITMKVTKNNDETLLRSIVKMVDDAQNTPPKSARLIEKIENYYVKIVLVFVGIMLFLPHFLLGWTWHETFYRAMILLVVSSPCALVASVTPATLAAISNGAKNGVLVKGGAYLETLTSIKAVCFDKTGTLTYGKPQITDVFLLDQNLEKEAINIVVSLEKFSTHPLAQAIVENGMQQEAFEKIVRVKNVEEIAGNGVTGEYENQKWLVGKQDFVNFSTADRKLQQQADQTAKAGKTIVYIEKANIVIGFIALQDVARNNAKETIVSLNKLGIETILITGDNENTARAIADTLAIKTVMANCLPHDKVAAIKQFQEELGAIAMIGDGINDAPALATADVGVAMGKGADIAMESADIVLMESDISKLYYVIKLAKKLQQISLQNIVFSLLVITLLITSNFIQAISLPLGVVGHEGSTILVILNGLRLLYFKNKANNTHQ